jgi:hypothetical protein
VPEPATHPSRRRSRLRVGFVQSGDAARPGALGNTSAGAAPRIRDLERAFALLMMLSTLADAGEGEPLITIPAQ